MSGWEWSGSGGGDRLPPKPGGGDEKGATPETVRALAGRWSLDGDRVLLKLLEDVHQTLVVRCEQTNARMQQMCAGLDTASVSLQNVNNRFNALRNSQFIESRVYDDDVTAVESTQDTPTQATEEACAARLASEPAALSATLGQLYDELRIAADSDSDSGGSGREDSVVLRPKDFYEHRPLPHIIGSRAWTNKWHAGLIEEDSDSDSSVDKREREDEEQYSSTDSYEAEAMDIRPPPVPREADTYSGDTAMSDDSASHAADVPPAAMPPVKPSPSDFAAELARRLGGAAPCAPAPAAGGVRTHSERSAQPRLAGNVFSDEPPPIEDSIEDDVIEDQNQDDDDDDIFADLHRSKIFNQNTNIFNQSSQPSRQSYGGLFDDILPADDVNRNERESPKDIFDDFADDNSNVFAKRSENTDPIIRSAPLTKNIDNTKNSEHPVKNYDVNRSGLFDDDEDDLFADIGIVTKTVSKTTNIKPGGHNSKGLFDEDDEEDGDIFSDKVTPSHRQEDDKENPSFKTEEIHKTEEVNANPAKETKQLTVKTAAKEENNRAEPDARTPESTTAVEESISVKKPIGGISLFGTKQGAESIGAAILKHARRKHSSSSEDEEKTIFENSEKEALKSSYDQNNFEGKGLRATEDDDDNFNDLFSIDKSAESIRKNVADKVNNPNEKFDNLFAQSSVRENLSSASKKKEDSTFTSNLHDDDDAIFSSTAILKVQKVDKKSEAIKDLFDDEEDLFSNITATRSKTHDLLTTTVKNIEYNSPLLFDDDEDEIDDLFVTGEKSKLSKNTNEIDSGNTQIKQNYSKNKEESINIGASIETTAVAEIALPKSDLKNTVEKVTNKPTIATPSKPVVAEKSNNVKQQSNIPVEKSKDDKNKSSEVTLEGNSAKKEIIHQQYNKNSAIFNKNNNSISNTDIPKSQRPGDDFFDSIFDEEPPAFQKLTEPKKSKNINALFDDDSDDEGLFLKKSDNLSVTNSDDSKSVDDFVPPNEDKLFGLFHSEPPNIEDINFATNKIDDNDFIEESPQLFERTPSLQGISVKRDDSVFNVPDLIKTYNAEPERREENTFTSKSKENRADDFEDLEYIKIVRKEDGQKFQEIISPTKLEFPAQTIKVAISVEKKNPVDQYTDARKVFDSEEFGKIQDTSDKSSGGQTRSPGKLKPIGLNINVQGLLPGASPKMVNKNEPVDLKTPNVDTEDNSPRIDHVDSASIVKSVSFEKGPESPTLVNTYSKERAKIQVKRRPSSRKARRDAIRKSAVDLDIDSDFSGMDVADNFTTSLPTSPLEISKTLESGLKANNDANWENQTVEEILGENTAKESNKKSSISRGTVISTLGKMYGSEISKEDTNSDCDNSFESKKSDFSDTDDIFSIESSASPHRDLPTIAGNSNTSVKDKISLATKVTLKSTELRDEDLFSDKSSPQNITPTDKMVTKVREGFPENNRKDKLFDSDDNDYDDLFKSKPIEGKLTITATKNQSTSKMQGESLGDLKVEKTEKYSSKFEKTDNSKTINDITKESIQQKPISAKSTLFADDISDDDLFGSGVKTGAIRKLRETKIDNIHGREKSPLDSEDDDLFFSKKKEPSKRPVMSKTSEKKSLFGDDDSDEDIFGRKSKTAEAPGKPQKVQPKQDSSHNAATSAEEVFDDPLSFFE